MEQDKNNKCRKMILHISKPQKDDNNIIESLRNEIYSEVGVPKQLICVRGSNENNVYSRRGDE